MSVLQLLLYVVFLTALLAWSAAGHVAVRADLTHVDSARGFTKRELLRRMAARTQARVDKRWSPPRPRPGGGGNDTAGVMASVSRDGDPDNVYSEYLIHLSIGTPRPQRVALTLDTGSDLIWTQCGCRSCFHQPFPALDASASTTLRDYSCFDRLCAWGGLALSGCTVNDNLCFYVHSNGDNSGFTSGKISEDTFTFQAPNGKGAVAVRPSLRFGCGMYNTGNFKSNESGVAGFGRGPMSLPSQLKVLNFSYCFTSIVESGNSSPVFLGSYGNLDAQATGPLQSTRFARGPSQGPNSSLYYLSLKGVTVGNRRLPFDASTFVLRADGSGGTIIDSGTAITTFPRAVFRTLREEFISQVSLPVANESTGDADSMLCFSISPDQKNVPALPKLILHLEGADWELPRESYVLRVDGDNNDDDDGLCVVINSAGDSGMTTVIGNFQQQNMHIAYDLGSNKLFFVPARCDKL
ncbi:aspartic proteinase nepenthesin-1 [Lolium perenne]|uniref:aspartic proteinase nepenthesin-1 n=1 Tax=Lolium perenne TaxID=4522 RepID=UPI0021EB263B|nr:aspartic proteinase nepenthesin-1-like [Lolium perenne]